MNRKNFIKKFNHYFEKNDTKFFHFNIEVKDYENHLEFKEKLYQKFMPFFEKINIKNKYDILNRVQYNKQYDSYYEEDNPNSDLCSFSCTINIHSLYDVIKKVEKYPIEEINIFRIEGGNNNSLYDTFFAALPVDEIHHPNPRDDPQFEGIFDHHNNDHNYYQQWNFAFTNIEQLEDWIMNEENKQKLQEKGCLIKKITIDKQYVIKGNKQLIFQRKEKIREEIVPWNINEKTIKIKI